MKSKSVSNKKERQGKITVNLVGGLGNQLFGYMFGQVASKLTNSKLFFSNKLIPLGSNISRRFEVNELILIGDRYQIKKSVFSKKISQEKYSVVFKIYKKALISLSRTREISENSIKTIKTNKTYSGYFQDWAYADFLYKNTGGFEFIPKTPSKNFKILVKRMKVTNPIVIHLRIGDYLIYPKIYKILSEKYYLESIKYLNNRKQIWIFTEDSKEAKKFYPKLISRANKVIDRSKLESASEVLSIMSKSRYFISSNSTLSLWAAWMCEKNNTEVIIPDNLQISTENKSLVDDRWVRYTFSGKFKPATQRKVLKKQQIISFSLRAT